jgi:spoIIIJ-associated protein
MTLSDYLQNFCHHCGFEPDQIKVEITEDETHVKVQLDVPADDSGLFIGFHGETLSSLQRIVRVMYQDQYPDKKIIINVNDYRQQREDKFRDLARTAAEKVLSTGRPYRFLSLTPHERFVVHSTISESPEYQTLESFSEGEDPNRVLIVRLKEDTQSQEEIAI